MWWFRPAALTAPGSIGHDPGQAAAAGSGSQPTEAHQVEKCAQPAACRDEGQFACLMRSHERIGPVGLIRSAGLRGVRDGAQTRKARGDEDRLFLVPAR
jgi:hypothetical protein